MKIYEQFPDIDKLAKRLKRDGHEGKQVYLALQLETTFKDGQSQVKYAVRGIAVEAPYAGKPGQADYHFYTGNHDRSRVCCNTYATKQTIRLEQRWRIEDGYPEPGALEMER
ncbi:hypothetical protein [Ferrimonas marina]|uniref:hypothetical protein n=1 Tax=Ferrimonas marina TaxID=299255 RepID=UPI0011614D36|nr:hypothetical protein [Ferrimonas marina]